MKYTLRGARVCSGMTQMEVAKELAVAHTTIVNWEKDVGSVKFKYILKLCKLYKIKPNDLKID